MKRITLIIVVGVLSSQFCWAWGRRGHQIVGETAALLVSSEAGAEFMRSHSFDFGYYANIPDFIWKRPATYELERAEHYMNLETFEKHFKAHPDVKNPFALSRKEFEKHFPEIETKAGRAFWRIRELTATLEKRTQELKDFKEPSGKARQALQEKWMIAAGPLAHYVGDLAMPLHTTENHDGELTDQRGIHSYFEDVLVDQLYPQLSSQVIAQAKKLWPEFKKKNASLSVLELIQAEAARSRSEIEALLKMDKKRKRDGTLASAKVFEPMIIRRLVDATLVLAEIYRRNVGFSFDDKKFYFFAGEPAHVPPGNE